MRRNICSGAGWRIVIAVCLWGSAGWWGCGTQLPQPTDRFISNEFGFEISVPADLAQTGWIIVRADEAAVTHVYIPPDSSQFEAVAVVAPPGYSFPSLAPFFVDIFRLQDPSMTVEELGDLRAAQVGTQLRSRSQRTINGISAEELTHGDEDDLTYELLMVGQGMGYSINTRGAPDTSETAQQFLVSSGAFRTISATFRFVD